MYPIQHHINLITDRNTDQIRFYYLNWSQVWVLSQKRKRKGELRCIKIYGDNLAQILAQNPIQNISFKLGHKDDEKKEKGNENSKDLDHQPPIGGDGLKVSK